MITPAGGPVRLARALALAVTTLALAAVAHLVGGGVLPGPGTLAVLGGVVALAALVASTHRLTTAAIAALLGGGQALLHTAFGMLGRTDADPAALGHLVGSGHHTHLVVHGAASSPTAGAHLAGAHLAGHAASTHAVGAHLADAHLASAHLADAHLASAHAAAAHVAGHAAGHHHGGLAMLLAHVLATVVTAVVLARGERALWLLAGWLAPGIRRLAQRPAHWPRPALPTLTLPRPACADVALVAPRRGPPVPVCPA